VFLHAATATDDSQLQSKINRLLRRTDSIVEPVQVPSTFWKGVTGRASDVLVVDRGLIGERAYRRTWSV
jgi:hypothetical protein